ncbi:MAG: sugar phosphate nucleotidyltransferase, partial [Bacteroidota bacterium]
GQPLLSHIIVNLKKQGFTEIVINVHHFHQQIIQFLSDNANFGIQIHVSDESDLLLDTGGGLKKAKHFLEGEESFLLYNVDILTDIDLNKFMLQHNSSRALVTLAVRNRKTSRYFLFDQEMNLCGWENQTTGEKIISKDKKPLTPFAFSGIHAVSPEIFSHLDIEKVFSINQVYLELAKSKMIKGYLHDHDFWFDIGKPESLAQAEKYFNKSIDE